MKDDEKVNALRRYGFWEHLAPGEKELLVEHTSLRHFSKGEIIHSPDEHCEGVMLVLRGELRPYLLSDEGREVTLYRTSEGDVCILTASCVLTAISFDVFVEASDETDVMMTEASAFRELTEGNIYVRCYGYEQATRRFSDVMASMQRMMFMSIDRRIASFLLREAEDCGSLTVKKTQQEIASSVGTAREVVSRTLGSFEKKGIVRTFRGGAVITDIEGLKKML
jgi:CRP/FNR family transcriptional regulator